jgi:hypothetical protein
MLHSDRRLLSGRFVCMMLLAMFVECPGHQITGLPNHLDLCLQEVPYQHTAELQDISA